MTGALLLVRVLSSGTLSAQLGPEPATSKDFSYEQLVKVRGASSDVELPLMPSKPKALRFNDLDGVLAEVKMVDWRE